jgi:hypothetical protein
MRCLPNECSTLTKRCGIFVCIRERTSRLGDFFTILISSHVSFDTETKRQSCDGSTALPLDQDITTSAPSFKCYSSSD